MKAGSVGKKVGRASMVNMAESSNQLTLPLLGAGLGAGQSQWHVPVGSLCVQQTQEGKCKKTQLICILLLFQEGQNVLEQVMTDSHTEGLCLHIEWWKKKKKKREEQRKRLLESSPCWKPALCNDVLQEST